MIKDCSIALGTKLHLVVKKDTESKFIKELKNISKKYVTDVDQFATLFNQVMLDMFQFIKKYLVIWKFLIKELKNLVNEMSLDDIERYDEEKAFMEQANSA